MIIGKQPYASGLMLHSMSRRTQDPHYLSAQQVARKDVAAAAGYPMDLTTEDTRLTAYLVAGSPLPTRPYRISTDADLDEVLTDLGCTRLTDAYCAVLGDPEYSRAGGRSSSAFKSLTLVQSDLVPHWTHSDRMTANKGFNPKDGDVFMVVLVQETFSDLMSENVVFILPFGDATLVTKGSEFLFESAPDYEGESYSEHFWVRYGSVEMDNEELRTMVVKGAN